MIVSSEAYSLGPDKKTRGKGKQSLDFIDDLLKALAASTGYIIIRLDTPNIASEPLLTDKNGFNNVTDRELNDLIALSEPDSINRIMSHLEEVRENTKIKTYKPSSGKVNHTIPERELDLIKKLNYISS